MNGVKFGCMTIYEYEYFKKVTRGRGYVLTLIIQGWSNGQGLICSRSDKISSLIRRKTTLKF